MISPEQQLRHDEAKAGRAELEENKRLKKAFLALPHEAQLEIHHEAEQAAIARGFNKASMAWVLVVVSERLEIMRKRGA